MPKNENQGEVEPSNPQRGGWIKTTRSPEAMEVIRANPLAYVLAAVIAHRARWREGFNARGLGLGEAFLGDYANYGMSQQQYRTAKKHLAEWGFATFRATSRGTIAKLTDTRLFAVAANAGNEPRNGRATNGQRAANEQPTTNEEGIRTKEHIEREREAPTRSAPSLKDVLVQCRKLGIAEDEGEKFFFHYESVNWAGITDWVPRLRLWKLREQDF